MTKAIIPESSFFLLFITAASLPEISASVFERDDHHHARTVTDCSRRMTLAGQVLRENSLARSEAMQGTVAQPDLDTACEGNHVLAARRVVPVDEGARRHPRED